QDSEKEKVILWEEPTTGVRCKSKLDLINQAEGARPLIVDFKTTSASSLKAFLECCQMYHYDRQMAFYADSIQAKQVCLIGVSKKAKRLFFVQKYTNSAFIAEGRRKYQFLLHRIQELNMYESIYYSRNAGQKPARRGWKVRNA
ncbi:MAG: PD-(D/E)XK nuclease-like domain-containing protein, partial [Bacteroidota bacterium]